MSSLTLSKNLLPGLVVIDVEASGLHDGSFPVEIGWCFGDLESGSFLVRPHWTWEDKDWSWESEKVHGISMRDCLRHGIEVDEAARRLNNTFQGYEVLASSPEYDGAWIKRLYDTAEIEQDFFVTSSKTVARQVSQWLLEDEISEIEERVRRLFAYTHRAEDDARYTAALLIALGGCLNELEEAAGKRGDAASWP